MPLEDGTLVPGDEGYVAPEVTSDVVEPTPEPDPVVETPDQPTWAQYTALLNAYTTLKRRVGLDAVYEKQLDTQAGII